MAGQIASPGAKPPQGWNRRSFVGGLVLGGVCGSLGTAALRGRRSLSVPDEAKAKASAASAIPNLDHERFMREAIARARNVPLLPFGAVIVLAEKGEVVAGGFNRSNISPTYHGEVDAINRCADLHPGIDWTGLVLYTTAEPCPMCESAVAWAGISMVVFGSSIPFLKSLGWWQIDIRAEEVIRRTPFRKCVLLGGVLEEECNALFRAVPKPPFRAAT
jgi:tRNA(adenine34) deaminase